MASAEPGTIVPKAARARWPLFALRVLIVRLVLTNQRCVLPGGLAQCRDSPQAHAPGLALQAPSPLLASSAAQRVPLCEGIFVVGLHVLLLGVSVRLAADGITTVRIVPRVIGVSLATSSVMEERTTTALGESAAQGFVGTEHVLVLMALVLFI